MTQQKKHPFIQWVDDVEKETGWSDNKWTTKANLSASVLSKARQHGVIPKWDACKALALAAKRSPVVAFRKAGLLSGPESDALLELENKLVAQMVEMFPESEWEGVLKRIALEIEEIHEKRKKNGKS